MLLPEEMEQQELILETAAKISKLRNMRLHLQELISKKARLEVEIKQLKKSIANKHVEQEKHVRVKLALESTGVLDQHDQKLLLETNPALYNMIQQADIEERKFNELAAELKLAE